MYTFRPCSQPCLESDLKRPTTLVLQTFTKSIHLSIFMYCYAYIVHSAACCKERLV